MLLGARVHSRSEFKSWLFYFLVEIKPLKNSELLFFICKMSK